MLEACDVPGRLVAKHHPFASPLGDELERLESDPVTVRAKAYDLVLNGTELGGGSVREAQAETRGRTMRCGVADGPVVARNLVPMNAGNGREEKTRGTPAGSGRRH